MSLNEICQMNENISLLKCNKLCNYSYRISFTFVTKYPYFSRMHNEKQEEISLVRSCSSISRSVARKKLKNNFCCGHFAPITVRSKSDHMEMNIVNLPE